MLKPRVLFRAGLLLAAGALAPAAIPGAHAAGGVNPATGNGAAGRSHAPVHIGAFSIPLAGATYLYAEDGTCPDNIEVFKVTGNTATKIQTFAASGACQTSPTYYGQNELAVAKAKGGACLVQASVDGTNGSAPGSVLSYTVSSSTGMIGSQVSSIPDQLGGSPTDVKFSAKNKYAVVTTSDYNGGQDGVSSYHLGAGCALTHVSTAPDPTGGDLPSSTVASNGEVVSTNLFNNTLDAFSLNGSGLLTYQTATPSQIGVPDSDAANGTQIFTGQATGSAPQAQAGTVAGSGAVSYSPGSPQADPAGVNGAASWFDKTHKNFVQAEQASSSLGFYHASPFAFSQHVSLAASGGYPTDMQQKGKVLFVLDRSTNDIEACTLTPSGASGCVSIATLSSASGSQQGLAVL
ncbi:MAG TPA: hypothetical protein VKX16_09690 [Chloroflexota bacterium]|nr:hypothetical protein [Chloroflexota bacterium]